METYTRRLYQIPERFGLAPCDFVEDGQKCNELTPYVYLGEDDIKKLNRRFPDRVSNGLARGTEAILFILENNLGENRCPKHAHC